MMDSNRLYKMYKMKDLSLDEEPLFINTENKGQIKSMVNMFLQQPSSPNTSEIRIEEEFVPFKHERDKLGRIVKHSKNLS